MSDQNQRNQRWIFLLVAFLAFGAAMFFVGRSTAPAATGADTSSERVATAEVDNSSEDADDDPGDAAADDDDDGDLASDAAGDPTAGDESDVGVDEGLPAACEPVDYDTVALSELPAEAFDTIVLIDDGPPYPYRQDGGVFQNREGRLPDRERGYYHEFTVETPGSDDRGARRIVTGDCGELYYTGDHYDSFELIDIEQ